MDELIKKYRNKLRLEGGIKAAMLAATIAAACAVVVALIVWLLPTDASVVWIAVGLFLGLTVAVTPVIYFVKYRTTDIELARRLDRLGLSERVVTMLDYTGSLNPSVAGSAAMAVAQPSGVNSAMLAAQTADTAKALNKLASSDKKAGFVSVTAATVIPLAIALVPFVGMTVVGVLTDQGVIPTGYEIIRQVASPVTEKYYTVNYRAALVDLKTNTYKLDEGGFIDGDDEQLVAYTVNGDNEVISTSSATPVLAIEDDDCVFICWDWDQNLTDPYRLDAEPAPIGSNYEYDEDGNIVITHIAFFARLEGGDGSDEDGEPGGSSEEDGENGGKGDDDEKEGDQPQDAPSDENQDSDKKPDDSKPDDGKVDDGDPNNGRGGEYNPDKDNIIDGNQNYRDLYQQYYDEAMEMIANGQEIPEYYKKIIEAYFGVIV